MSETWRKILQFQEEIRRQRENPAPELNRKVKPETERKRYRRIETKGDIAVRIVTSVLEEIRANSEEICQAPLSEIFYSTENAFNHEWGGVNLWWGNKFGMTKQEMEIVQKYCFIDDRIQKQAENLPTSFIGEDFYSIRANIYEFGKGPGCVVFPIYISSPDYPMKELARQLIDPKRHFTEYIKGVNYWQPPRPDSFRKWEY